MKRWPTILLIVSLFVNIFLFGAIAGSVWHWTHGPGFTPRGGWRARAAQALPERDGDALRAAIRDTVRNASSAVQAGRAARAEAAHLFVQPAYDANAIAAQLDRARTADMALRASLENRVVQFAGTLPQSERQKLAEALKTGPLRQPRHR
ncbi:periplasmic heavy metal sensor [Sphingomonas crusticola]|uniref:periplasmic heavy metal sensor n=1 Tax=Sphingomonas crusticola TaxID=1697973 RepID=UPI000E24F298|nr:periplasmic heavy metal sensor [Sphingomonas crusticola]